jgi:hypothetical protein
VDLFYKVVSLGLVIYLFVLCFSEEDGVRGGKVTASGCID